jgi:DNA-binding response OmpR family regulator
LSQLKKILIVDDEEILARSLQAYFRHHGWEAWIAGTGESAVIAATQFRPGIILLDFNLPDMNGFQVLSAVRMQHCCACILMTGNPEDAQLADARRHGIARILSKPFSMAGLELVRWATAAEFCVNCSEHARQRGLPDCGGFAILETASASAGNSPKPV